MLGQGTYTRTEGAPSATVHPRFFVEPVLDELATAQQGRKIYREEERVEIIMPGIAALHRPVHRVTQDHAERWPREYEAFKSGLEASPDGIPIEEWPALTRGMVLELKAIHIRTVEDIAGLSDSALQAIRMGGLELRNKARAYLDDTEHFAQNEKLTAENARQAGVIASLEQQVKQQGELLTQLHAELMARRNMPDPVHTTAPMQMDPMEAMRMQSAGIEDRPTPSSSLAAFADTKRRPGRPRREPADGETLVS